MRWDEWRGQGMQPVLWIKKLVRFRGCIIQIHKFVRSDGKGCFHTHPAWAIRVVLWGGYVEELWDGRKRTWWPGRIGVVHPELEHRTDRLLNGKNSYSLWLRGPRCREIVLRGFEKEKTDV